MKDIRIDERYTGLVITQSNIRLYVALNLLTLQTLKQALDITSSHFERLKFYLPPPFIKIIQKRYDLKKLRLVSAF